MKIETISGSIYEIDADNRQIRRLIGRDNPTPRMGKDGEWRKYAMLSPNPIVVGNSLVIVWNDDVPTLTDTVLEEGQSALKTTMTSPIKTIIMDGEES